MTQTLTLAHDDVQEAFFERGWTDGFPVVPPTPEKVVAMLAAGQVEADDILGVLASRQVTVTAAATAINAVMAGCLPAYFPIVLAAVGAIMDPAFNVHAALTSTGGAAFCVIVSGPYGSEVGLNNGHNALGGGRRANATIGRTLRLLALNVFGARPGETDGTSVGNPGRASLCFGESIPPAGWPTLREQLGYIPPDTTVTVMATEGPRQVANHLNGTATGILATFASALRSPTTFVAGKGGQAVVVLGPEHALALAEGGWAPDAVRHHLAEASRIHPDELAEAGILVPTQSAHRMEPGSDGRLPVLADAADVVLVTAGGAGAGWSACIPSWASTLASRAATRRVRPPGEVLPDCGPDGCALPTHLTLAEEAQ